MVDAREILTSDSPIQLETHQSDFVESILSLHL